MHSRRLWWIFLPSSGDLLSTFLAWLERIGAVMCHYLGEGCFWSDQTRGSADVAETDACPSLMRAEFTWLCSQHEINGISAWLLFLGERCRRCVLVSLWWRSIIWIHGKSRGRWEGNRSPSKEVIWEQTPLERKFRVWEFLGLVLCEVWRDWSSVSLLIP